VRPPGPGFRALAGKSGGTAKASPRCVAADDRRAHLGKAVVVLDDSKLAEEWVVREDLQVLLQVGAVSPVIAPNLVTQFTPARCGALAS
jgi:hypothetical protein